MVVAGLVDALAFVVKVEAPVGVEASLARTARILSTASVPSTLQRAPVMSIRSATRYRHVPSMTPLAASDGPALREGCGVVQVVRLICQVLCAGVGLDALVVQLCGDGPASDAGGDLAGVCVQHGQGPVVYPGFSRGVTFVVEASHRGSRIFQHISARSRSRRRLLGSWPLLRCGRSDGCCHPRVPPIDGSGPGRAARLRRRSWRSPRRRLGPRSQAPTWRWPSVPAVGHLRLWWPRRRRGCGRRV